MEATSADTLSAAYQEINSLLLTRHDVTAADADFSISTQDSLVETANSTNKTLTVLLTGVAAISLLVGGVGVMNIMLVSVTERIREIGLRKALGATPSVIGRQFLVEASMLGLAGGVAGILIGVVGSWVLPAAHRPAGHALAARDPGRPGHLARPRRRLRGLPGQPRRPSHPDRCAPQ